MALIATLWTYDGWYAAIYMAEETLEPARNVPRAMITCAGLITVLYVLINAGFLHALSVPALASFAIFQFLWVWNDLLVALTFVGGTDQTAPITVYLSNIKGTYGSSLHLITAGAFIAIIVLVAVKTLGGTVSSKFSSANSSLG